jgi:uncharacterized membrane protein HdeD (DUF308 family)
MSTSPESPLDPLDSVRAGVAHLREHWILLLILGIFLVIVGTFAISAEFIATLATVEFFGMLLLIGGILEIVGALTTRHGDDFWMNLLTGILSTVVGLLMMHHPGVAAAAVTLMLAASFIVGGVLRVIAAALERFYGWPWAMISGFISMFLGFYIWQHFPGSAFWVIGLFVGIDLIFAGWTWIFLALGVRRAFAKRP